MRIIGIIPARYASTRFPGKPLALIAGKSLIQRVVEQCQKAKSLAEVVVATVARRNDASPERHHGAHHERPFQHAIRRLRLHVRALRKVRTPESLSEANVAPPIWLEKVRLPGSTGSVARYSLPVR